MSKIHGKPDLNGPRKGNFQLPPIQRKPDWGNDQTQNNKPFPGKKVPSNK